MANPPSFPFFETDVAKILSSLKVPGVDTDAILAAQRKNIEAVTEANKLALEGMQAVARRQAEILRTTFQEVGPVIAQAFGPGAPDVKVSQQAELVKTAVEKALSNMKELAEMVAKSNSEASSVISKRVSEGMEELKVALAKVAKK